MKQSRSPILALRRDAVFYEIEITGWTWPYTFGLKENFDGGDPYRDDRSLHLTGALLEPSEIKLNAVRVFALPRAWLSESARKRVSAPSVGDIRAQSGELEVVLALPADALLPLMTALAAGAIKYLSLEGAKMVHRQCDVRSYSFDAINNAAPSGHPD